MSAVQLAVGVLLALLGKVSFQLDWTALLISLAVSLGTSLLTWLALSKLRPDFRVHKTSACVIVGTGTLLASVLSLQERTQGDVSITIQQPEAGRPTDFALAPEGFGLVRVVGTVAGRRPGDRVFLFVLPRAAGAHGWYLQLPPNGVKAEDATGHFQARVQIGNDTNPATSGAVFDLAAVVLKGADAKRLSAQARGITEFWIDLPQLVHQFGFEVLAMQVIEAVVLGAEVKN